LKRPLLAALFLGICLIFLGTGLFIWHAARQLARGSLLFGISEELLANPPIASEPGIANRIVYRVDPIAFLQNRPTGTSNAAASYIEVIISLTAREATGSLDRSPDGIYQLSDTEFEIFMEGVRRQTCDFSRETLILEGKPVRLAPVTHVSDNPAHILWLRQIARAVVARGKIYEANGDSEAAIRCYESTVKFGVDIMRGRESILQVLAGAAVQKMGAQNLKEFYESEGDTLRARQWSDFLDDLERFVTKFREKTKLLTNATMLNQESIVNRLWILRHDEDHVFRREALAGLAVSRFLARDTVDPVLEDVALNDPDPYVREAAQNALKLVSLPEAS